MTLSQKMNMTAAIIVTTPQELSFADVVRGIDMFDSVNMPCVALVANMAYYEVDNQRAEAEPVATPMPLLDVNALMEKFKTELTIVASSKSDVINNDKEKIEELAADLVEVVRDQEQQSQTPITTPTPPPYPETERVHLFDRY